MDLYGKLICQNLLLQDGAYDTLKDYEPAIVTCLIIDYLENNETFILSNSTVKKNIYVTINEFRFISNNKPYNNLINHLTINLNEYYSKPFDLDEMRENILNKRLIYSARKEGDINSLINDIKNDLYYFDLFIKRSDLMYGDIDFLCSMNAIIINFGVDDFDVNDLLDLKTIIQRNINKITDDNIKPFRPLIDTCFELLETIDNCFKLKEKKTFSK